MALACQSQRVASSLTEHIEWILGLISKAVWKTIIIEMLFVCTTAKRK